MNHRGTPGKRAKKHAKNRYPIDFIQEKQINVSRDVPRATL
jgi:hypothetical protein